MLDRMFRGALGAAAVTFALLPMAGAQAHATLETTSAPANSYYKGVVRISHGCKGSPTVAIRVTLPEGVIAAKPMAKPGWAVSTAKGAYERGYAFHGQDVKEGVKQITWSGGPLPDDFYDEFVFSARIADAPAGSLYFPVLQTCETGATDWAQIPAAGDDGAKLERPAPFVRVAQAGSMASDHSGHMHGAATAQGITIGTPWARATPAGAKVAGGFMVITNKGGTPDRLIGGTSPIASEVEVHEMAVVDGIMKMRPLDKGLAIEPGKSVELKPGSYHVMFMGLNRQLKEGEKVDGVLEFEKAGKVPVVFEVRGIGAGAGAASSSDGHEHKH